jgi:hypothetical protein
MGNSSSNTSSLPLAGQQPGSSKLLPASELAISQYPDQAEVQKAVDGQVDAFVEWLLQSVDDGDEVTEEEIYDRCCKWVEDAAPLMSLPSQQYSLWKERLSAAFEQQSKLQQQLGNEDAAQQCLEISRKLLVQLDIKRAALGLELNCNFDDESDGGSADSKDGSLKAQQQQQQPSLQPEQVQIDPAAKDAAGWPLLHRVVMAAVSQAPQQQQQQQQQPPASDQSAAAAAPPAAAQSPAAETGSSSSSSSSKLAGTDAAAAAAASSSSAAAAAASSAPPAASTAAAAAAGAAAAATAGTNTSSTTSSSSNVLPSLQEVLAACDDLAVSVDMPGPGGFTALHLACAGSYTRLARWAWLMLVLVGTNLNSMHSACRDCYAAVTCT